MHTHTPGKFSALFAFTREQLRPHGTGHTHLISRFLFFHLASSGFFGPVVRGCNHLCLPLAIHHPPDPPDAIPPSTSLDLWSSLCAIYPSRSRRPHRLDIQLETQRKGRSLARISLVSLPLFYFISFLFLALPKRPVYDHTFQSFLNCTRAFDQRNYTDVYK